ncbi:nucleotidyltransferase domain-containing protein [archaeon]|nr:nucleotidyltransferase domain-containing protein [archaeon]
MNNLKGSVEANLSSNYIPKAKMPSLPMSNEIAESLKKKEAEKTKKDIDNFAKKAREKFKFIEAISVVPTQANKIMEEDYEVPEADRKKELIHVVTIIPEKQYKKLADIRLELIKIGRAVNEKIWLHVLTPIDVWNLGLDSKFDTFEAIAMSFPVYDKNGFLAGIRVSSVHKSLVLRKFEKYVTTYAIGGSFARGETVKTSDIDVFVIIDDTDVKRMGRIELLEKLRGITQSFVGEAMAIAGVKVDFNLQVWLLTDFWERVKDTEPVAFTFIRDGIPLYDRGSFLPWKSLLRMGRIKPSPEAIDMFMSQGEKYLEGVDRRIFDIVMHDIYWGVMQPTQGLLMLYGLAPQNVYDTVKSVKEVFVEKEKLLEKRYFDIFDNIVIKHYKAFEHGKIKPGDIDGVKLAKMNQEAIDYNKRIKELRIQLEQRVREKSIEETYTGLFEMLEPLLDKKGEAAIIRAFDTQLIKTGKYPRRHLTDLKFVAKVRTEVMNKKETKKAPKGVPSKGNKKALTPAEVYKLRMDVETARRFSSELTNLLIEHNQRCEFLSMDRKKFMIRGKDISAEVFFLEDVFLIQGQKIQKLKGKKLVDVDPEEVQKEMLQDSKKETNINFKALDTLRDIFGEFELVY